MFCLKLYSEKQFQVGENFNYLIYRFMGQHKTGSDVFGKFTPT